MPPPITPPGVSRRNDNVVAAYPSQAQELFSITPHTNGKNPSPGSFSNTSTTPDSHQASYQGNPEGPRRRMYIIPDCVRQFALENPKPAVRSLEQKDNDRFVETFGPEEGIALKQHPSPENTTADNQEMSSLNGAGHYGEVWSDFNNLDIPYGTTNPLGFDPDFDGMAYLDQLFGLSQDSGNACAISNGSQIVDDSGNAINTDNLAAGFEHLIAFNNSNTENSNADLDQLLFSNSTSNTIAANDGAEMFNGSGDTSSIENRNVNNGALATDPASNEYSSPDGGNAAIQFSDDHAGTNDGSAIVPSPKEHASSNDGRAINHSPNAPVIYTSPNDGRAINQYPNAPVVYTSPNGNVYATLNDFVPNIPPSKAPVVYTTPNGNVYAKPNGFVPNIPSPDAPIVYTTPNGNVYATPNGYTPNIPPAKNGAPIVYTTPNGNVYAKPNGYTPKVPPAENSASSSGDSEHTYVSPYDNTSVAAPQNASSETKKRKQGRGSISSVQSSQTPSPTPRKKQKKQKTAQEIAELGVFPPYITDGSTFQPPPLSQQVSVAKAKNTKAPEPLTKSPAKVPTLVEVISQGLTVTGNAGERIVITCPIRDPRYLKEIVIRWACENMRDTINLGVAINGTHRDVETYDFAHAFNTYAKAFDEKPEQRNRLILGWMRCSHFTPKEFKIINPYLPHTLADNPEQLVEPVGGTIQDGHGELQKVKEICKAKTAKVQDLEKENAELKKQLNFFKGIVSNMPNFK